MKKVVIALSLLMVGASANAQPRATEKIWVFYESALHQKKVGEVVFFCDGGQETTGFISSEYVETYFGC